MSTVHSFTKSLNRSKEDSKDKLWKQVYQLFWPGYQDAQSFDSMVMQKAGVDDGIRWNGKTVLIDRKVRFERTDKRGRPVVYSDVALEYLSDEAAGVPGWVCKDTKADYWIYLNRMNRTVQLIPIKSAQAAWQKYKDEWIKEYPRIPAFNNENGRKWVTLSRGIPVNVLNKACQEFGEGLKTLKS